MNILADASLPGLKEAFPSPFNLSLYNKQVELQSLLGKQDILLCRASLKVNPELLAKHQLSYVATASSGSDNLDKPYLQSRNITFFDAKGCNATSVVDYVLSCLALLDKVSLIKGRKLGIIGLGHVGSTLYRRLKESGFELFCYDPLKATTDSRFKSCQREELYQCDVLCVHAELHNSQPYPSNNFIDKVFLQELQPECVIINASRGGIVNENAVLNTKISYCTDVYLNEPHINQEIIKQATICTPHIAGHSLEAKYAAVAIISKKIHAQLGLPEPQYLTPSKATRLSSTQNTWQELALSLYNPLDETQELKQATNLDLAFINSRHAHKNRHDFYTYFDEGIGAVIKSMFF